MEFKSIDEIKEYFKIDFNDKIQVKEELIRVRNLIHPNNNQGEFRTNSDKDYYHQIEDALKFIDPSKSLDSMMITHNEIKELAIIAKELQAMKSNTLKVINIEDRLERKIELKTKYYFKQHLFPKITVTSVFALLSAIWVFPKTASSHEILKNYLTPDNPTFVRIWFLALIFTLFMWLYLKFKEKQRLRIMSMINIVTYQNNLFEAFSRHIKPYLRDIETIEFTKDDVIKFIINYDLDNGEYCSKTSFRVLYKCYSKKPKSLIREITKKVKRKYLDYKVDVELAEYVADIILNRAIDKKVIQFSNKTSLSDKYEMGM